MAPASRCHSLKTGHREQSLAVLPLAVQLCRCTLRSQRAASTQRETTMSHRLRTIGEHVIQQGQQQPSPAPTAAAAGGGGGVLSGVTVVEMSMVLAAPMCCALMADMGATVLKVEPPGGEIWRNDGPPEQFQQLNRGKQSVVLDVRKQPEAMVALKKLLAKADVFVTNLREPALLAQGLDYETLRHEFPRLVYAHMTAWGRGGPKKDDPGYDIGGFLAATGLQSAARPTDDDDLPRNLGGLGDFTSARDLLLGVLGGLFHQQRTGEGQLVDACLLRSGIFSMGAQMSMVLNLISRCGKRLFLHHFYTTNDQFTKTGSGRTQKNLRKEIRFSAATRRSSRKSTAATSSPTQR
jgi:crotonobetainyl-CoA:carnitine CoA-transferase CaiB-like acyl-CoA transferase